MLNNHEVLYVAFGYEYLLMAAHSAKTAKSHNQGIKCTLITNMNFDNQNLKPETPFDRVIFIDKSSELNREIKTNVIKYASGDYCVYIDCDTEVLGSFDPIFRCLDVFDIAMKINVRTTPKVYEIAPGIPYNLFPAWNAGVIFFKNNRKVARFFEKWSVFYREEGRTHDQPTLARAIYNNADLKLLTLNNIWNTFPEDVKLLRGNYREARIWHYREPNYWPQVAPAILAMHNLFAPSLSDPKGLLREEMAIVEQRYKLLATKLYKFCVRYPLLIRGFKIYVKIFAKLGRIKKVKLTREIHLAGVDYETRRIR